VLLLCTDVAVAGIDDPGAAAAVNLASSGRNRAAIIDPGYSMLSCNSNRVSFIEPENLARSQLYDGLGIGDFFSIYLNASLFD